MRGQTPIHRHSYRRDRVSAISAITVSPVRKRLGLCFQLFPKNITGVEVVGFLRNLLRTLPGKVDLLWDRGTIHKRRLVKDFLLRHPRIHVHEFPSYAPELNPDEYVWTRSKQRLSNTRPDDLDELGNQVHDTLLSIAGSTELLRSCIEESELEWDWK